MNQKYNNSLAEDKVLILYTLNKIEKEILKNDLFLILSSINNINYFYYSDILEDLVSSKLIDTYTKENEKFYQIGKKGKSSLKLTIDLLPGIIKLKADNLFQKNLNTISEERSITSEYIPENEHNYTVKCKIMENDKPIFEVDVFAGSNKQAKSISDNWKQNAHIIYPKIIELLNTSF